MANAVTRVVLRCEDAQETNNLGKSFFKKYIYLRKYFTKLTKFDSCKNLSSLFKLSYYCRYFNLVHDLVFAATGASRVL